MDKIRFRAKQVPTGIIGAVMFQAQDLVKELGTYLKEEHKYEARKKEQDPTYELEFDVQVQRWYKRRTLNANNLQWELCTRLAAADGVSKELVHNAVKEIYYPRDEYNGVFVPKAGSELSTVEFAKVIEALANLCVTHDPAVEIWDIWILFTEWRFGQEKDPLGGTYAGKDDYREKHPCCEGCGKFLLYTDKEGVLRNAGEVAHIVSEGSGGADEDWNWLLLCAACHRALVHEKGWDQFLKAHPHLAPKVERARGRSGKGPVDAKVDNPQPSEPPDPPGFPLAVPTPAVERLRETKGKGTLPWPKDDEETVAEQARTVQKVFGGDVVEGDIPPAAQEEEDQSKQVMLDRIRGMQDKADEHRKKYYQDDHPTLFDQVPEKVDPKKAQYKDDDEPPEPKAAYDEDGNFIVPPNFG